MPQVELSAFERKSLAASRCPAAGQRLGMFVIEILSTTQFAEFDYLVALIVVFVSLGRARYKNASRPGKAEACEPL